MLTFRSDEVASAFVRYVLQPGAGLATNQQRRQLHVIVTPIPVELTVQFFCEV